MHHPSRRNPSAPAWAFLLLAAICFGHKPAQAQETVGLHITALTNAERDLLVANAKASSAVQVVYACVPAGIVVFSAPMPGGSREALRSRAVDAVAVILPPQRIQPEEINLQAAEAACASVRGQ